MKKPSGCDVFFTNQFSVSRVQRASLFQPLTFAGYSSHTEHHRIDAYRDTAVCLSHGPNRPTEAEIKYQIYDDVAWRSVETGINLMM